MSYDRGMSLYLILFFSFVFVFSFSFIHIFTTECLLICSRPSANGFFLCPICTLWFLRYRWGVLLFLGSVLFMNISFINSLLSGSSFNIFACWDFCTLLMGFLANRGNRRFMGFMGCMFLILFYWLVFLFMVLLLLWLWLWCFDNRSFFSLIISFIMRLA